MLSGCDAGRMMVFGNYIMYSGKLCVQAVSPRCLAVVRIVRTPTNARTVPMMATPAIAVKAYI